MSARSADVDAPSDAVMNCVADGAEPNAPAYANGSDSMGWDDDWRHGDRLEGGYELVEKLGEGGMSQVYEGRHVTLGTRVAIKTLRPALRKNASVCARFDLEGKATARVHHPHVVKVMTVGAHKGSPFLVMAFLTGGDLERRLLERGRLSVAEALAILIPVCSAVQEAHNQGLIHRDLKPANIVLEHESTGHERPVVVDFGIAHLDDKPVDHIKTGGSAVLGTPAYMSPEQTRGAREVTALSDQYALGVILYECLAGASPFDDATVYLILTRVANGDCIPLRERCPEFPAGLTSAVMRAMSRDPDARFPSVREFARALIPFADDVTRGRWTTSFTLTDAPPRPETTRDTARENGRDVTTLREASREVTRNVVVSTPRSKRGVTLSIVGAVVLLAALLGVALARREKSPTRFAVDVLADPPGARIVLDGVNVATGRYLRELPADGRSHTLRVEAAGFVSESVTFSDTSPPRVLRLRPEAPVATAPRAVAVEPVMASDVPRVGEAAPAVGARASRPRRVNAQVTTATPAQPSPCPPGWEPGRHGTCIPSE